MINLTPEQTIRRLGWKAARQSLKETRDIIAPRPPYITLKSAIQGGPIKYWLKSWATRPWRTVLFWVEIWKHSRKDFVKEYTALAKQSVPSREIFRQTKRRMHLTEDEIFEQGKRIFEGYTRGQDVGEMFHTSQTKIPTGTGEFPTVIDSVEKKKLWGW